LKSFALLLIIVGFSTSNSQAAIEDTITKKNKKLTKEQFLQTFGSNKKAVKLINTTFSGRQNSKKFALYATIVGVVIVALSGLLLLNVRYLSGIIFAAAIGSTGYTFILFALFALFCHLWVYSKKRLLRRLLKLNKKAKE
jgi:hypothetical protein